MENTNSIDIVDSGHERSIMDKGDNGDNRKNAHPTETQLAVIVGRSLQRARERGRFTPGDVAALVRVSRAEYERYERGEVLPSVVTFCLCAIFLGVSGDELLGVTVPSRADAK